jgi:transposase-like protein
LDELFAGRHFDREAIDQCVRWYLRFKLSLRDLVEMMAERGLSIAQTTIKRWVQRCTPEFEKRWQRFGRPVHRTWRVDETYVKTQGEWRYLYHAIERAGTMVDFSVSAKRDVQAAKVFIVKAINSQQRARQTITLDGQAASHHAVREPKADGLVPANTTLRSSKSLNNLIERDRQGVKRRSTVMLGFEGFRHAVITVAGIELTQRSAKTSSGCKVWEFTAEVRLQAGTPCLGPEACTTHQRPDSSCCLFAREPLQCRRESRGGFTQV